jgi:hypothetical protein
LLVPLEPPLPPSSPTLLLDEPPHATGVATVIPSDVTKRNWFVFMRHLLDPREIHKILGLARARASSLGGHVFRWIPCASL